MKSARTVSERLFGQLRYRKRRNTVCTRKGYAASVSRLTPATAALYFPFLVPKSGRKRSAHSRRRFIQRFLIKATPHNSAIKMSLAVHSRRFHQSFPNRYAKQPRRSTGLLVRTRLSLLHPQQREALFIPVPSPAWG